MSDGQRLPQRLIETTPAILLGFFIACVFVRGGTPPAVVAVMTWVAAISLLWAAASRYRGPPSDGIQTAATWCLLVALLALCLVGVAGLIAVDSETWLALPGRADYGPIVHGLTNAPWQMQRFALAIDPPETVAALQSLICALAAASLALTLPRGMALRILGFIAVIAVAQGLLGLLQVALNSPSFLAFGAAVGGQRAAGTFVNKNNYATLLALALPILILRSAGRFRFGTKRADSTALRNGWWGIATAVVAAALVSSISRAGVTAGALATVGAVTICFLTTQERRERWLFALIALVGVVLATASGLALLLQSLESQGLAQSAEGRHALNLATWQGIRAMFPVGAGLGSYAIAFQRFQPGVMDGFIGFAHNDYLQLLFELGVAGALVLLALAAAFVAVVAALLRAHRSGAGLASPAAACFLGCAAFALHAWFDFPSHVPALAWIAATIAALATRRDLQQGNMNPELAERTTSGKRRRRRSAALEAA